ncbi:hypothetical protein KFE98_04440 [bacterium SCSIO 12741]|nr:hypothetical protein KFE98_04440 [bacterium SCSIO 12741]
MNQAITYRIYFFSLLLVVITLPFFTHLNSICIALFGLSWLLSNHPREKWKNLKANPWVWLFIAYYLVQVYGWLISEESREALFILEKKGGMALLPIFLASGPRLMQKQVQQILLCFTSVVALGALTMVGLAGLEYLEQGDKGVFFYHPLAYQINAHAIYYSLYIAFALFIWKGWRKKVPIWLYGSVGLFLFGVLLLLSSKNILILFLLIWVLSSALDLLNKKSLWKKPSTWISIVVIVAVMLALGGGLRQRFQNISGDSLAVLKLEKLRYDTPLNGLSLRLLIWDLARQQSEIHGPWYVGVGTGDAQQYLDSAYVERGLYTGNVEFGDTGYLGYNLHNQYFQDLYSTGLLGLFALLTLLGAVFWLSKGHFNPAFNYLAWMILFLAITESLFERHTGSVFFVLFFSLMLSTKSQKSMESGPETDSQGS